MSILASNIELFGTGVVIRLRPIITSSIFTIISAISGLSCVSAVLVFLALTECRNLRKGRGVSAVTHSRRVKVIQIMAILTFISIETIMATQTKDVNGRKLNTHQCVSVRARDTSAPMGVNMLELERQSVTFRCMKVDGAEIEVYSGDLSLESTDIICARNWTFRYENSKHTTHGIPSDAVIRCGENGPKLCAAVFRQGRNMFTSLPFIRNVTAKDEEVFASTELNFDAQPFLPQIAQELVDGYVAGSYDELNVRSRLFLNTEKTECQHGPRRTFTFVPNWILAMNASFWVISVLLFAVTRFLKRSVFFDLGLPLHWATRTDLSLSEGMHAKRTHVYSVVEDEVRRVYLRRRQNLDKVQAEDESPEQDADHDKA